MAETLYQPNTGTVDRASYDSPYDKTFDEIRKMDDNVPREGAQFFGERTTNLETYKEGEVSPVLDTPMRNEDTDTIPMLNSNEGYNQTWTNYQYRAGMMLTRRAIKSQKTNVITSMMTGLPNSTKRLEELAYNSIFSNGFTSESGGDGSYAFASDHNYEDIQHGAWSNKSDSDTAFSSTSYMLAWLNMQQRKNDKGWPDPKLPKTVYYPVAIHEEVMKVRGSDQYPQNNLNAKMPELFGQFQPVPGHWLTSPTAWFVHSGEDNSKKGFIMVWQDKPQYFKLSNGMNPQLVMGREVLMSFSVGVLHGRDWYSNVGS